MSKCVSCGSSDPKYRCTVCKQALVCSIACKQEHDTKGMCPNSRKIVVTGEHTVRSIPDTASISLQIEVETPSELESTNVGQVVYFAAVSGPKGIVSQFSKHDLVVESNSASLYPVIFRPKDEEPRVTGYKSIRAVTLVTSDPTIVDKVLSSFVKLANGAAGGGNYARIQGVDFMLRNSKTAELKALYGASENAKQKIKALASSYGDLKWEILEIVEDGYSRSIQTHRESSSRALSAHSSAPVPQATSPGFIETSKTIKVTALIL